MDKTTIEILKEIINYGHYCAVNTRTLNAAIKMQDNDIVDIKYIDSTGVYFVTFKKNKIIEING